MNTLLNQTCFQSSRYCWITGKVYERRSDVIHVRDHNIERHCIRRTWKIVVCEPLVWNVGYNLIHIIHLIKILTIKILWIFQLF